MSIMSSLLLFLLLCLTMQACKGRYLGVIVKDSGKQVQLSVKEVVKERLENTSYASEVMISNSAEIQKGHIQAANGDRISSEGRGGPSTQRSKDSRVRHRKMMKKRGKVTAVSQVKPLVSVSWHMSHNKQEGHPGFNSDYAPPKTHPPSHN